ncbi:hypothetical protein [Helicobacter bizzozeronii]|uniref:OMP1798 n=1 Tax=Helicobacter bizzozeronii TaxID=56877 RepID=A0A1M4NH90_HELBI|nr:hypothetical protein [Helicobacter bizzozeronii]SFZ71844.1 OMP1798 [Helicobacter bizzozeronii]
MTSNFSARYFFVSASLLSALGAEVGDVRNGFFVGASMGARSMSIAQVRNESATSSVGNYFRAGSKLYKAGFAAQNLQTLKESLQNLVKKLADLDAKIQAAAKTKDFKDLKVLDLPNLDALEKNVADAIAQLKAQNNPDLNKALEGYSNALDELKAYGAGLLKEASDYNKDLGEAQGKYDTAVKNYQTEEAKHKVAVQQAEAKYEAEVKNYNAAKAKYDTAVQQAHDTYNAKLKNYQTEEAKHKVAVQQAEAKYEAEVKKYETAKAKYDADVQQARDTYNAAKAKYDANVQQAKNDYTSDMQKYNTAIGSYGNAKKKYGDARDPLYKNLTNTLSRFEHVTGPKAERQAKIREIVGKDYNGSLAEIKKAVKDNLDNLKTLSEVNYMGETVRYSADSAVKQGSWEAKQRVFSWNQYDNALNIGAHLREVGGKPTKDQGICGIHGSFDRCINRFTESSNFADYSLGNLTELYAWMQNELDKGLTKYQDVDRLAGILSLYHDKSFDGGMVGGFREKLGKSLPAPDAVFDSQIAQPTQATFTKPTLNLPNAFSDPKPTLNLPDFKATKPTLNLPNAFSDPKPTLNLPDFKATAPTAPTLNFNPSDMSGKIASVGQQVDGLPKAVSIPSPTQTPKPTASNPPTPQVPSKPQPMISKNPPTAIVPPYHVQTGSSSNSGIQGGPVKPGIGGVLEMFNNALYRNAGYNVSFLAGYQRFFSRHFGFSTHASVGYEYVHHNLLTSGHLQGLPTALGGHLIYDYIAPKSKKSKKKPFYGLYAGLLGSSHVYFLNSAVSHRFNLSVDYGLRFQIHKDIIKLGVSMPLLKQITRIGSLLIREDYRNFNLCLGRSTLNKENGYDTGMPLKCLLFWLKHDWYLECVSCKQKYRL